MSGQPWRILACGTDDECRSIAEIVACAPLPFDLATFSENLAPLDVLRRAVDDEHPFEAVIVTHSWISTNDVTVVSSILAIDAELCMVIEALQVDQPSDCIITDRVMAVPNNHLRALTLAAALAQKCRLHRLYTEARDSIDATKRAARLVSSEFQRQQRGQERQLDIRNEQFETALNNMPQGVCMFDAEARLVVCNDRYVEMYGMSRDVATPGTTLHEILTHRKQAGSFAFDPTEYCRELTTAIVRDKTHSKHVQTLDGRTIAIVNREMAKGGWVSTHEDVTERTKVEARIRHMARHDSLTGVSNRASLEDEMERALARVRDGGSIAVLCLDLDHFKTVNDTLGHPIGDKLLCAVTARLRDLTGGSDTLARLGGDEFVILQAGIDTPADAESLAQRVITAIDRPFDLVANPIVVSTSIGIAVAPRDGTSTEELMRNADMALYAAKADGRATYRFFEPEMDQQLQARHQLETDLRSALGKGEFELFYQPQVDAISEQITGCEALLRWRHPTRGLVPALDFIPLAEEIGLIVPIGEWVFRQACREAMSWPASLRIAVNLSPAQFKSRTLIQTARNALADSGLDPARLELEITETVLLDDTQSTIATLHQPCVDLGIKISMDDFGTGYASLSNLHRFPFDKIKIDRSFVDDIADRDSAAIIKAVVWLGKELGITTVAEGVETPEQLAQVRSYGCTEVQGFLFGRPQPAEAARALVNGDSARKRVA